MKFNSFGCGICTAHLEFVCIELPNGNRIKNAKLINEISSVENNLCRYIFKCMNCGAEFKLKRGEALSESNCIHKEWRIA